MNLRWVVVGGLIAALVAVPVALLPTECLTQIKVAQVEPPQDSIDPDPLTTCHTRVGVEWAARGTAIVVVVIVDALLACVLALLIRRRGLGASP